MNIADDYFKNEEYSVAIMDGVHTGHGIQTWRDCRGAPVAQGGLYTR